MSHQYETFFDKFFRAVCGYSRARSANTDPSVSFGPFTLQPQTGVILLAVLSAMWLPRFGADYFLLREHFHFMIGAFAFDLFLALSMILGVAVKNSCLLLPAEIFYTLLRFALILAQCFFAACVIFFSYLFVFWETSVERDHLVFIQRAVPTAVLTLSVLLPLVEMTGFYVQCLHLTRRSYAIRVCPEDTEEKKYIEDSDLA